jgi:hypothetical protein
MRGGPSGPLRSTGGSAATNGCCCYFSGSCSKHLQGALSDIRQGSLIAISAKLPRLTGRKFQSLCTKQAGQCRLVGPIATERACPSPCPLSEALREQLDARGLLNRALMIQRASTVVVIGSAIRNFCVQWRLSDCGVFGKGGNFLRCPMGMMFSGTSRGRAVASR